MNVQRQSFSDQPFSADLGNAVVVAPGVEYTSPFQSPLLPGAIDLTDETFTLVTGFPARFDPSGPNGFLVTP